MNGILLFKIWLTTFLSASCGEAPQEERTIIPLWPSSVVLVPGSRSGGGDCVTHLSQAGLACQDVLSFCKETCFWKSVASLGVSSIPHYKNCPGMPMGQWIPVSTFLSSFWSTELLRDLLPVVKNALLTWLTSHSFPFHTHGMPRQRHKASASLLHKCISHNKNCISHKCISHNTNCTWKTVQYQRNFIVSLHIWLSQVLLFFLNHYHHVKHWAQVSDVYTCYETDIADLYPKIMAVPCFQLAERCSCDRLEMSGSVVSAINTITGNPCFLYD